MIIQASTCLRSVCTMCSRKKLRLHHYKQLNALAPSQELSVVMTTNVRATSFYLCRIVHVSMFQGIIHVCFYDPRHLSVHIALLYGENMQAIVADLACQHHLDRMRHVSGPNPYMISMTISLFMEVNAVIYQAFIISIDVALNLSKSLMD